VADDGESDDPQRVHQRDRIVREGDAAPVARTAGAAAGPLTS
jgi:hypothetical protein